MNTENRMNVKKMKQLSSIFCRPFFCQLVFLACTSVSIVPLWSQEPPDYTSKAPRFTFADSQGQDAELKFPTAWPMKNIFE